MKLKFFTDDWGYGQEWGVRGFNEEEGWDAEVELDWNPGPRGLTPKEYLRKFLV